jgi:alpha-L-arabinofuranosidase
MADGDVRARNTREDPERVAPHENDSAAIEDGTLRVTLPPVSWTAVSIG